MNKQITKYSALALGLAFVMSQYVAATAPIIKHINAAREVYYAKLKAMPWGQVAEKYIKELTEEEASLWLQLDKAMGNAPGAYKNMIDELIRDRFSEQCDSNAYKQETDPNDETTREFVRSLLKECGLDPKYIGIAVRSSAQYRKDRLPESTFNLLTEIDYLSDYGLDWILVTDITNVASVTKIKVDALQSIMHIMHYDALTRYALLFGSCEKENADSEGPAANKQQRAIMGRLFDHIHKRSDALVALLSPEYAVQHIENIRSLKNVMVAYYKDEFDADNVKFYDKRIAFLETIYKEMLECQ